MYPPFSNKRIMEAYGSVNRIKTTKGISLF